MDDLFRKLGSGANFNIKRFKNDANSLKLFKRKNVITEQNKKSKIAKIESIVLEHASEEESEVDGENDSDSSHIDSEIDTPCMEEPDIQLMAGFSNTKLKTQKNHKRSKLLTKEQKLAQIRQEEVNRIRNKYHINVKGEDIPAPCETFAEFHSKYRLSKHLIENVKGMQYETPTPVQMQTIPIMINKRDVMVCAPTGSGKTAAFIVPLLHLLQQPKAEGFRVLVVSPTRELAKQTYEEFRRLAKKTGYRIFYLNNSNNAEDQFGPKSSQKFDILVCTPNRLIHLINKETPIINLKNVEWLILDESDKLFEAGTSGFREQLASIYTACDKPGIRRAMFSATFSFHVEQWCKMNLDNVVQVCIGERNSAVACVTQKLLFVGSEPGKLVAIRDIINKGIRPPVLVFVESKDRAKQLLHELTYEGIHIAAIHSDLSQQQREDSIKSFRKGVTWILICTELMGRGIDFKGVHLVINYDFPKTAVSYIHRIGRTGRAGKKGNAVTFFTESDAVNLRGIANLMKQAGCIIPDFMLQISKPSKNTKRQLSVSNQKREDITKLPRNDHNKFNRKKPTKNRKGSQKIKKNA